MADDSIAFRIPIHPEDLLTLDNSYGVENPVDIESFNEKTLSKLVDDLGSRLSKDAATEIIAHENFDNLYGLLQKFTQLNKQHAEQVYQIIRNGLASLISIAGEALHTTEVDHELYNTLKNGFRMYAFLLHWFNQQSRKFPTSSSSTATTKGKRGRKTAKKDGEDGLLWDDETQKEHLLSTMIHILELDLGRLWKMTKPEDEFLNIFVTTASNMLENPLNVRTKVIKRCIFILIANLVKKYQQAAGVINSLINLCNQFEHLPAHLAELIEVVAKEYHYPQIVGEILREVGRIDSRDSRDTSGLKNTSVFIAELGERLPKVVLPYLSILMPHLSGESYTMRNGIIQMIGFIVAKGFIGGIKDEEDREIPLETRDDLINILEERFLDVSSFSRSKVLQTWQYLCTEGDTIPRSRIPNLAALTVDRLRDRVAGVRKNAIQLLTTLMQYNPFDSSLRLTEFATKLEELQRNLPSDEENEEDQSSQTKTKREDKDKLQFLREAVVFTKKLHDAVPILCQLLGSKNNTDVLESIQFFITATNFNLEPAQTGIRKMLMLIWSKEADIREAVLDAYYKLYISEKENSLHKDPTRVATNLINLTINANLGELTSFEELLSLMMSKKYISSNVVKMLWAIFAKQGATSTTAAKGAIIILSMVARGDPSMIKNNLGLLVKVGLGSKWKEDESIGRYTCIALQRLASKKSSNEENKENKKEEEFVRFKLSNPLFQKLGEIIKDRTVPHSKWYGAAEQAINAIFVLCEKPDACCAALVKEMASYLFPSICRGIPSTEESIRGDLNNASVDDLTKLFFVLGQVALKQLIHIEDIQSILRKRRPDSTDQPTKQNKKAKEAIEEELGVAAAAAEHEVEFLQDKAEKEIVGKNLLGTFATCIALVCANAGNKFNDHTLRTAAVLALCKFMCVSSEFCDKHLQLLFTVLRTAPEAAIRSNIVIALGDLAFRFPNLIEPWTPTIYSSLRDKDTRVRKNTLMVLSHLILNDMIKVKGQISEMALCIEDQDSRIADLAKLFFHELAQKANTIYNILPDLISSISTAEVAPATFKSIMKYLFSFIEKEKQTESLVEKLCHRFRTGKETEWRNIAYCLSLLNFNDKAIKKLIEYNKLYHDKLNDEDVLASFSTILSKSKKWAKPELKEALATLEKMINVTVQTNDEDAMQVEENADNTNATVAPVAKSTRGKASKGRGGTRGGRGRGKAATRGGRGGKSAGKSRSKKVVEESESEESDYESDEESQPAKLEDDEESEEEPSPKTKNKVTKIQEAETDDGEEQEDDSNNEEEPPKAKSKQKAAKKSKPAPKKGKKKVIESESESQEEDSD